MSKELIDFYAKLHQGYYGQSGHHKANIFLTRLGNAKTVLEFGCGKGSLLRHLRDKGYTMTGYDPAVPEFSRLPETQFDAVISGDCLEHIPYDEIDDVLKVIVSLTKVRGVHYIATSPANLRLPDGSDAHIIQQMSPWWKERFEAAGVRVTEAVDTGKPNGRDPTAAIITYEK